MEWVAGGVTAALFAVAMIGIIRQDIREERDGVTRAEDVRAWDWTRSKW